MIAKIGFGLLSAVLAFGVQANVYKCSVGGKIVYQEAPCGDAEIRGDTPWERERAARKRADEERTRRIAESDAKKAKADAEVARYQRDRMEAFRSCKAVPGSCEAEELIVGLRHAKPAEVIQVLGNPDSVQSVGSTSYYYYSLVLSTEAGKSKKRVQVVIEGSEIRDVNVY